MVWRLLALLLLFSSPAAAQDIYKWKDEKGQWHFSDRSPGPQEAVQQEKSARSENSDCAPLTLGETRRAKSANQLWTHPHLQFMDFEYMLIDAKPASSRITWRIVVRNNAVQSEGIYGAVKFLDCSGFLLGEDIILQTSLPPGQEVELTGQREILGTMAQKVGRATVAATGTSAPRSAENSAEPAASQPRPRLEVMRSELVGGSGETYVSGEVLNWGPGAARDVRVNFKIQHPQGSIVLSDTVAVDPPNLPPSGRGTFRKRVGILGIAGYGVLTEAESAK